MSELGMKQLQSSSNSSSSSNQSSIVTSSTTFGPLDGLGQGSGLERPICTACQKVISERFLLKALDQLWHEDCLKCSCCDCRLGEVGSSLYTKANLILCRRDYLRLFGNTGICSACSKTIPAFEMVMRAKGHNYHLECFACQKCSQRFCVGDRFYLFENRILCEYDYDMMLSNGGSIGSTSVSTPSGQTNGGLTSCNSTNWSNSLEKLKKQTENIEYNSTNSNSSPAAASIPLSCPRLH